MPEHAPRLREQHLATLMGGAGAVGADHPAYHLRATACHHEGLDLFEPQELDAPLSAVLCARRSVLGFAGRFVSFSAVSTLLGESAGLQTPVSGYAAGSAPGPRPYPSGGAIYPVEILVFPLRVEGLGPRFWYFQPLPNRLVPMVQEPASAADVAACYANACVADASVLFLLFVDFSRPSVARYGSKSYRLLLLEAGHLAQNVLLVATALGLSALPLCGFDDERLARLSGLTFPDQSVLYSVAIGAGT